MNSNISSFLTIFSQEDQGEYISLDPGARYIKAVYVSRGSIKKFLVSRHKGDKIKVFSKWLRKEGLITKKVKITVKGSNTLVRYVAFPKVDKKKLKEVFGYEISRYVPFKAEDVYFDTALLDENYSDKEFLILVAVAKKEFIDSLINELRQEKINIDSITLNNIALINLYLDSESSSLSTGILDIGASSALLNLFKKGIPLLSREIKISGDELLDKIARVRGLSREEVERIIVDAERGNTGIQEAEDIIRETGSDLSEEIKSSLDYFEINFGERVQKILLTGGLSKIDILYKTVEDALGIKMEIWNPFTSVSYSRTGEGELGQYKELIASVLGAGL